MSGTLLVMIAVEVVEAFDGSVRGLFVVLPFAIVVDLGRVYHSGWFGKKP